MDLERNSMIEMDYQDLSDTDVLVLLIIKNGPVRKTRLQKLSLLFHELYDTADKDTTRHVAYFFGGYSDEIDESAIDLKDMGAIEETAEGYRLTEYGRELTERIVMNEGDTATDVENLVRSVRSIGDRELVGITYHFYKDTAVNSTIKQSVDQLNSRAEYDGIPLESYPRERFESNLRNGTPIRSKR